MSEKALRVGGIALAFSLWLVIVPIASLVVASLVALVPTEAALLDWVPGGLAAGALVTMLLSALLLRRTSRLDLGVRGRARLMFGGAAAIAGAVSTIALAVLLWIALHDPGFVALGAPFDLLGPQTSIDSTLSALETVALGQQTWGAMVVLASITVIAWVLGWGTAISAWFLLDERVRRIVWWIVDAPLVAAFVFALWTLPFRPPEEGEDPTLPAIALAIATAFGIRMFARSLSPAMDVIERIGFQALVAARMLRAKKSGFLTVIGLLSILAVSFSSCTLTTTLSVMGGFRDDLQRKILGNNAHVVIDREYGTFEGWAPTLERTRALPGVVGASPYVAGEVMVTSASNLGGAILRGIDPTTIGDVTDLPGNMTHGRLEYLLDPERLLHLSTDEMTGSVLSGSRRAGEEVGEDEEMDLDLDTDAGAAPDGGAPLLRLPDRGDRPLDEASHESLMRDIDRVLRELDAEQAEEQAEQEVAGSLGSGADVEIRDAFGEGSSSDELFLQAPRPLQRVREVLPGLIVGQELARSLRLHVGDEVNVVSPLGDLGPAGPIPRSRPFRVAGIFYSGMYEYDMKVAYTDLETAQRFLSTGGAISGIEVKVDDWERAEVAAAEIAAAIARPELRVRSWQEVNRNLFGALELEKLAMFITLGIAILVASFCIVGTLVLMVQEKGREVGILKAMGADDRQIVGMFMLQGLLIGVVGAASGLGIGWVLCFTFQHYPIITLNPEVYYIDRLPIHTEPIEFVVVGIASVIVCLLATIYPAILGSRLRPVDALRYS